MFHPGGLRWQCRRGMRELDVLLSDYLEQHYAAADEPQKAAFHTLLSLPDPELAAYLLGGAEPRDEVMRGVVERILLRAGPE